MKRDGQTETERERERETDRQTDSQTDRQTDREGSNRAQQQTNVKQRGAWKYASVCVCVWKKGDVYFLDSCVKMRVLFFFFQMQNDT